MIERSQIFPVGTVTKTHGVRGEMVVTLDEDIDLAALRCVVFDMDGLFVPFFISSCRPRGRESVLVTLDGVPDEVAAATFCGRQMFALKEDLDFDTEGADTDGDDAFYLEDLIGFTMRDTDGSVVGIIDGYDDSTDNVLFKVKSADSAQLFIPAADDLITEVDVPGKTLTMDLPKGLF